MDVNTSRRSQANYGEILRLTELGFNHSQIALGMGISRQTVVTALQRANAQGLGYPATEGMSDREIEARLFPPEADKPEYKMPDYEWLPREMAKPGVMLQLWWFEYSDRCQAAGEIPYQLTQFKKYYRDYVVKSKATMHIHRKPGEIMEVDWAGQTAELVDSDTGEIIPAYMFVKALPYSGYSCVEAFLSQDKESWIAAHVNAQLFGGTTRILVPDNLKTGVQEHAHRDRAEQGVSGDGGALRHGHHSRPRTRAKDKATVEGTVGILST